jgi:hypothetical protein
MKLKVQLNIGAQQTPEQIAQALSRLSNVIRPLQMWPVYKHLIHDPATGQPVGYWTVTK